MITPIIINRLQWKAYLIFTITNFIFIPIIYFLYPETSNLELEEVDYIFSREGNAVKVAREMQKELAIHGKLDVEGRLDVGGVAPKSGSNSHDEKRSGQVEHTES